MVVFFYSHTRGEWKCFSQFYKCSFTNGEKKFNCAEQYMMYKKSKTFPQNEDISQLILDEISPSNIKKYGRIVRNFNGETWDKVKFDIVVMGNYLKFSQNPALGEVLLLTGDEIIAEASSSDNIWGIGLNEENAKKTDMSEWGENLLGKALMKVRDMLRNQ